MSGNSNLNKINFIFSIQSLKYLILNLGNSNSYNKFPVRLKELELKVDFNWS